jgi:hypothetical protein
MRAASDFRPESGIPFAAFALRRIHYAVSVALQKCFTLVRVPLFETSLAVDAPMPSRAPRQRRANLDRVPASHGDPTNALECDRETVGQRLRRKCEFAVTEAAKAVAARTSRGRTHSASVIEAIVSERLFMTEAWRCSLRRLARRLGETYGSVAACERRLTADVMRRLRRDASMTALLDAARSSPLGMRQPIDAAVEKRLGDLSAAQFMRVLADADDDARAAILRKLLGLVGDTLLPAICRSLSCLPTDVRDELLAEAHAGSAATRRPPIHRLAARRCA